MTQKQLAFIELGVGAVAFIAALFGLKAIIDGSLMAVVLVPFTALAGCMLFEDGDRRIVKAKKGL